MVAALVAMPVLADWQVVPYPHLSDFYSIDIAPNGTIYTVGENGDFAMGDINGLESQPYPEGTSDATDWRVVKVINDDIIYIGGGSIVKSIDGGNTWIEQYEGDHSNAIQDMHFWHADSGIAIGRDGLILRTVDGGENWLPIVSPTTKQLDAITMSSNHMNGFIVGDGGVMLLTENAGENWSTVSVPENLGMNDIAMSDNWTHGLIVGYRISLRYNNDANEWVSTHICYNNGFEASMQSVALNNDGSGISCGPDGLLYNTTDNGVTWSEMSSSVTTHLHQVLLFEDHTAWVVGDDGVVMYNAMVPVSVESISNMAPNQYTLEQNYPNPFNPSTNIEYSIPIGGDVNIIIYNSLGQKIDVLVDGFQTAGTYRVDWNGSNLPSGMYFYQISTLTFTKTMKMVLVK